MAGHVKARLTTTWYYIQLGNCWTYIKLEILKTCSMSHTCEIWDCILRQRAMLLRAHTLIYSSKAMDRICIASATLLIYCVEKINSFKYAYIYVYHLYSWTVLYQFHYQLTSDCQYAPWYGGGITAKKIDVLPVHAVECEASLSTNLRCYFENISPGRNKEIWSS